MQVAQPHIFSLTICLFELVARSRSSPFSELTVIIKLVSRVLSIIKLDELASLSTRKLSDDSFVDLRNLVDMAW